LGQALACDTDEAARKWREPAVGRCLGL